MTAEPGEPAVSLDPTPEAERVGLVMGWLLIGLALAVFGLTFAVAAAYLALD
jgi:hypothetical protein